MDEVDVAAAVVVSIATCVHGLAEGIWLLCEKAKWRRVVQSTVINCKWIL